MSQLSLTLLRTGFLVLLWALVLTAIGVLRSDLYGTRVTTRPPARRATTDVAASAMDNILKMNPTWWNRGELKQPLMEAMAEALGSVGALQLPIDWKAAINDSFIPAAKTQ